MRSTQSNQRGSSSSGRFIRRASEPSDIGCANSAITSPPPLAANGSRSLVASASSPGRMASMRGLANTALTSARYRLCSGGAGSIGGGGPGLGGGGGGRGVARGAADRCGPGARGGEALVVGRGGGQVVVAREEPEPAVAVRVDDRAGLADRPDDALRILDELRGVMVEAHAVTAPRSGAAILLRRGMAAARARSPARTYQLPPSPRP